MEKQYRSTNPAKPSTSTTSHHGIATLIVMITVLLIIILFCCLAAPGIRGLCRRYIFRTCAIDDPDLDNTVPVSEAASPTIILLPYGRMVVVDRRVLAQLRPASRNAMELVEIRLPRQLSTPSLLDSSETSKGISPTSLGLPPPTYEEIFPAAFPPSYSEISLMFDGRRAAHKTCSETVDCEVALTIDSNMNEVRDEPEVRARENDNNNNGCAGPVESQDRANNNC